MNVRDSKKNPPCEVFWNKTKNNQNPPYKTIQDDFLVEEAPKQQMLASPKLRLVSGKMP